MDSTRRRARQVFKIPSYLGVHKSELERRIQTRRETADRAHEKWTNYSDYINREGVCGYYDARWTYEAKKKVKLNAKAVKFLQIKNAILSRRAKLTGLLKTEEEEYVKEIRAIKQSARYTDSEDLARRVEEIKTEREKARLETAERRKYQMWKRDNPRLRSAQVERRRQEMVDLWCDQNSEKMYLKSLENEEKKEERRDLDLEKEKIELEKKIAEKSRVEKQQKLRIDLENQINELTARERVQNQLQNEERQIMLQQEKLHKEEEHHARLREKQKKRAYQNILYRQYRAQLLRRSQEIERELDEDLDILERVKQEAEQQKYEDIEKRKEAQKVTQDAIQILQQKLKEEKETQQDIEYLYREQAAQWWDNQEATWERERNARKALLKSVLEERQNQLTERLGRVKFRKERMLAEREVVLADIEQKKNEMKDELKTQREKRDFLVAGLDGQIEEQNDRIIAQIDMDNKENQQIAATAREIEDLEVAEEDEIFAKPATIRQGWR